VSVRSKPLENAHFAPLAGLVYGCETKETLFAFAILIIREIREFEARGGGVGVGTRPETK
jgi:hypothetical protein